MKKLLSLFVSVPFLVFGVAPAIAQGVVYEIGKAKKLSSYVEVLIENIDRPGEPISLGDKFKVTANCIIDINALYASGVKTESGQVLSSKIDSKKQWTAYCRFLLRYKDTSEVIASTDFDRPTRFDIRSTERLSLSLFENVAIAESTSPIVALAEIDLYSTSLDRVYKGRLTTDDISTGLTLDDYQTLFVPKERAKPSATPTVVELDGTEEGDLEPLIAVKKESASSYLITILNYRPSYPLKLRAIKKANKTYSFSALTDTNGDVSIRAKRNLKGYKLELVEGGIVLSSKVISQ